MSKRSTEILYGVHPVREAFKAGRREIFRLYTTRGQNHGRIAKLLWYADKQRIPVQTVTAGQMAGLAQTDRHQGVCIETGFYPLVGLEELYERVSPVSRRGRLLLLDNVVDPHNLGALIRTACCAAFDGVITTKDRSAPPTPTVSKTSAGALEHIRLARITNMARTIKELQRCGLWVVGLAGEARLAVYEVDLSGPTALVVGSEAKGIRPLVKKTCDRLVAIPQSGTIDSLNASVAGGIAIYEIYRQQLVRA